MASKQVRRSKIRFLLPVMACSCLVPPVVCSSTAVEEDFRNTDRYTFLRHDMNGDSRTDYIQRIDREQGWKDTFYLDTDFDGRFEQQVVPRDLPPDSLPHIVLRTL